MEPTSCIHFASGTKIKQLYKAVRIKHDINQLIRDIKVMDKFEKVKK